MFHIAELETARAASCRGLRHPASTINGALRSGPIGALSARAPRRPGRIGEGGPLQQIGEGSGSTGIRHPRRRDRPGHRARLCQRQGRRGPCRHRPQGQFGRKCRNTPNSAPGTPKARNDGCPGGTVVPSPALREKVASVSEPDEGEARKRPAASEAARPSPSHASRGPSLPRCRRGDFAPAPAKPPC